MSEINELYQELILDHYAHPRHHGPLPAANRTGEGYNPLCGDQIQLRLVVADDVIRDIAFEGAGCAISTAAASVMAEAVMGKTVGEAMALFEQMMPVLTGTAELPAGADPTGKLAAFAGVRDYPMRVKCATLAWHTLREALADTNSAATSEA